MITIEEYQLLFIWGIAGLIGAYLGYKLRDEEFKDDCRTIMKAAARRDKTEKR